MLKVSGRRVPGRILPPHSVLLTLHTLVQSRSLTHKIAVVGSGPSGFYTITELFKHQRKIKDAELEITLFDQYPTPFGLSRYGVAPDHSEVKNCEDTFTEIVQANASKFKFVGNVKVGHDVKIEALLKNFNSVVLSYGNTKENRLGLKNEDHAMCINSKNFVGWYNSEPNILERFTPPDLTKVEKVTIIGNGNVAMDIARMLLMPSDSLKGTDISHNAIELISKNNVKELNIFARRGILESKFTTKEIRELLELEQFGVKFNGIFPNSLVTYIEPFLKKLERVSKRKFETILKFLKPVNERKVKYEVPEEVKKEWSLQYLQSPYEIKTDENGDLKSIVFQKNRIEQVGTETKIVPVNKFEEFETDLIITSLGYKGELIEDGSDLKFDAKRGILKNNQYKVIDNSDKVIEGLYTTGWISNDSKGPILNTLILSNELSEVIIKDINNNNASDIHEEKKGFEGLEFNGVKVTNWQDWNKLNQFEIEFGKLFGKSRWKVPTVELMIAIIESEDAIEQDLVKFREEMLSDGIAVTTPRS